MQSWDSWINKSTNLLGASAIAPFGGSMATESARLSTNEADRNEQQLNLRRVIDNKLRYGQKPTDLEYATARKIGAF